MLQVIQRFPRTLHLKADGRPFIVTNSSRAYYPACGCGSCRYRVQGLSFGGDPALQNALMLPI